MSSRKSRITKRHGTISIRTKLLETPHRDFKKTRNLKKVGKTGRYTRRLPVTRSREKKKMRGSEVC